MSTFKCKSTKHGWAEAEIRYDRPTHVDDEKWLALVGSKEAINDLALKAWVIEAQRVAREGKTPEAGQLKVDAWRYKGDAAPAVMDLQGVTFTKAQISALQSANPNVVLTNYESK